MALVAAAIVYIAWAVRRALNGCDALWLDNPERHIAAHWLKAERPLQFSVSADHADSRPPHARVGSESTLRVKMPALIGYVVLPLDRALPMVYDR